MYGTIKEERPDLVAYLINKDDADSYQIGSARKLDWICPNCGNPVGLKAINKVVARGIPCRICGDGVSKSEKVVQSAFRQAGIAYETQKVFTWSGRKRYDFYLPDQNCIVEVNGSQHYTLGFKHLSGVTLEDQQRNDRDKMCNAIGNGIDHYMTIKADDTSARQIVPQLIYKLSVCGIYMEADVAVCEKDSLISNVVKAAELWNQGLGTVAISADINVSTSTVIDYLKTAYDAGLCDYTVEKSHLRSQRKAVNKRKRKVKCTNTGEVFESIADACRKYGITTPSNVIRSCVSSDKHAGSINGELLKWEYVS